MLKVAEPAISKQMNRQKARKQKNANNKFGLHVVCK